MLVEYGTVNVDKSTDSSRVQPLKRLLISSTFFVSKDVRSNDLMVSQAKNISNMLVTFDVSKLDTLSS